MDEGIMKSRTNTDAFRWLVLAGAVIVALCSGLLYMWSVYVKPMCAEYGWSTDQVALMGNVMVATLCLGGFIGGQMLPRMGAKACAVVGGLLFGGFMFVSSFVSSPAVMYITYGILSGTGAGILYNSMMFTVGLWFPDRRGLAIGIYLGAFGLATTLWSKPISSLLASIGVQNTIQWTGLGFSATIVLIGLFIMKNPPEGWLPKDYTPPQEKASANVKSVSVRDGLKTTTFWLITVAQVLLVITYNFINPYAAVYMTDIKMLSAEFAVSVVAAMGIGSLTGRLAGGYLADKLGNKIAYLIACLSSIIACVVLVVAGSPTAVAVSFFLIAFGYGGRTPIYGTLAVDSFGARTSSSFAGFTNLFTIITSLLSGVMTASIKQATGSYNGAFYVAIAAAVIGCTCIMLLPKEKPVDKI